jgi:hypothetical protein
LSTRARRWWIITGLAAWALLLLGLGTWSAFRSPPTIRDQSSINDAKRTIDETVGRVSGGLPSGWHVLDDGYDEKRCDLSVLRDGVQGARKLTLSGPSGGESAAIEQIAATLPEASLRPGSGAPQGFFVDAGTFVAVRGKITEPGMIVIDLTTGCRPN